MDLYCDPEICDCSCLRRSQRNLDSTSRGATSRVSAHFCNMGPRIRNVRYYCAHRASILRSKIDARPWAISINPAGCDREKVFLNFLDLARAQRGLFRLFSHHINLRYQSCLKTEKLARLQSSGAYAVRAVGQEMRREGRTCS